MNLSKETEKIVEVFKLYPEIKLAYLFGSQASGKTGPLSDYDFAVYFDEEDSKKRFDLRLKLMGKISKILKTNKVDVCVINDLDSSALKYSIIKNGKILFEQQPFKLLVEPLVLNEYFDFHKSLVDNNLTKMP